MDELMTIMAGFGLATGAGAKAFIPLLALGGFHYTPYFELSPRFTWLADPAVLTILGALVVLEIVVDAHPDLGRYSDVVAYLPKVVAGFIGFAAVTGQLDSDLAELGASGVLGAGTAGAVHWLRTKLRRPFRDFAEDAHESAGKAASLAEAGASASLAGTSVVAPPVSMALALVVVCGSVVAARRAAGRRAPCVHCGEPIRPGALVCPHCKREQDSGRRG
jgi:hypothetical protein